LVRLRSFPSTRQRDVLTKSGEQSSRQAGGVAGVDQSVAQRNHHHGVIQEAANSQAAIGENNPIAEYSGTDMWCFAAFRRGGNAGLCSSFSKYGRRLFSQA
jgi:hypothetical protein